MVQGQAHVHALHTMLEAAVAHAVEQLGSAKWPCAVVDVHRLRICHERGRTDSDWTCTKPTTPSFASSATSISSDTSVIGTSDDSDLVSACQRRNNVACGTGLSGVICAPWRSSSVASR